MNLFDTTQLGLERAAAGAAQRQATLAGNIANADTPGYLPRDVRSFARVLKGAAGGAQRMAATDPRHLAAPNDPGSRGRTAPRRTARPTATPCRSTGKR